MKIAPVTSSALRESNRLDAKYFSSPAVRIRQVLQGTEKVELRRIGAYATVRAPSRFKRAYAAPGEEYVPYLRPYDVFEFLPPEADRLSIARTNSLDDYLIDSGEILQTCSGRNLGPVTIADDYLSGFALSHDMIRIAIQDEEDRYYTLAFLQSPAGQSLLRGDLNGSVIDHISTQQVESIQIPFIDDVRGEIADLMRGATKTRETARTALRDAIRSANEEHSNQREAPYRDGWTVNAGSLSNRLDAAFHSKHVRNVESQLVEKGGMRLGDVAQVVKPGGRPKLYYVAPEHGTPFLSGRQILQAEVVGAKHISARSISTSSGYGLGKGWITFQADGRAEESLGYPSVVLEERADWFASGHVGRVIPKDPADSGWIWVALASDIVQEQIAALACGSVVDALYEEDLESVILPPRELVDSKGAQAGWDLMSEASRQSAKAINLVEESLRKLGV